MNERIKALAIQTVGDYSKGDYWPFFEEELEKFAELIVKECGVALNPPVQNRNVISRGQAYDLIKKHFGVGQ